MQAVLIFVVNRDFLIKIKNVLTHVIIALDYDRDRFIN